MLKTGVLHKSLQLLISLALFAGLALTPTQPAYAATYTVDSLEDTNDGSCGGADCTLREAINLANVDLSADTIQIGVSGTITLTSGLPSIPANGILTIDGSGQSIRINGHDLYRPFGTGASSRLTLKHLTIENGYNFLYGGAIWSAGTLIVDDCKLLKNTAGYVGGAIYSAGTLTVDNSLLQDNLVNFSDGGAIFVYTNTMTTITNSVFNNNDAEVNGGAIQNYGTLYVNDSTFSLNSALNGNGGAIYNHKRLDIQGTNFGLNLAEFDGGALYHDVEVFLEIRDSAFKYNTAGRDGGGAYIKETHLITVIDSSEFIGNFSYGDGGGIRIHDGDVDFNSLIFRDNEAGGNGGGVYNETGFLRFYDATFEGNDAGQDGGGVFNHGSLVIFYSALYGNQAGRNGGGIYHANIYEMLSTNNTFYDNEADKGGGLYSAYVATIENCTFSANRADHGGGAVYGNDYTNIFNTILANSLVSSNCGKDAGDPPVTNQGNNIDSGTSCAFGSDKDSHSNTDPLLGPLQLNGGQTKTMALLAGSQAIDGVTYGTPPYCISDDQRSYPRPYGPRCDIGAFERYYRLFLPVVKKN